MRKELRSAAIRAIQEGNINRLKAIKAMMGDTQHIPIHYQVFGHIQIYKQDGTPIPNEPMEETQKIEGLPSMVTSVVVVFPTREGMIEAFTKVTNEPILALSESK